MITDASGRLLEIRGYDGEYAHTLFYVFQNAVDAWLATFRSARNHDTVPVIMSTGRRAYFENQLLRHGFTTQNGQIPTPIISFWLNDFQRVQALDHPREIRWYSDVQSGTWYPDMIPFEGTWTVSFWTRKQADMWELDGQMQRSFNQGMRWIEFTDPFSGHRQFAKFQLDNRTDASNYEPGDSDQPLLRMDYSLKADLWLPLQGFDTPLIGRTFIDIQAAGTHDIFYISGQVQEQGSQINPGTFNGIISPGMVYFSGVANADQTDEEYIEENHQWGFNPFT